jgi:hypothetical protein
MVAKNDSAWVQFWVHPADEPTPSRRFLTEKYRSASQQPSGALLGSSWDAKSAVSLEKWLAALDDFRNWLIREAA